MKIAVVLALLAFAMCAQAQLQFTANFELRQPSMRGGVVLGTIEYSWANNVYRLRFTSYGLQEIHQYNAARGNLGSYRGQWLYRSGPSCPCETSPINHVMPQLFVAQSVPSNFTATGSSETINGVSCAEYTKKTGVTTSLTKLFWDTASNKICRAVFGDQEFTFSNVATPNIDTSIFLPPAGCKCSQPVDISIVLDRSGTISQTEFLNQKNFVEGFSKAFSYGPLATNLALVHFRKDAWSTLTMTEGISDANVQNSVEALKCCTTSTNPSASCCCCGTSISSGTILGADELAKGRPGVEKVLIVITDGYHNHNRSHLPCPQGSAICRSDLQWAVDYSKAKVPGVTIWAVGVGPDKDLSAEELLIIGGTPDKVLRYTDFTNLAQNFNDLVASACHVDDSPCGVCCGFCNCGNCAAPDLCESRLPCTDSAVEGVCCKEVPKNCPAPNKCAVASCDAETSTCKSEPVQCKAATLCFNYTCQPDTGSCLAVPTGAFGCSADDECQVADDCNDNNACTEDQCINRKCVWTDSSATCNDNNACTDDSCDPKSGCINTPKSPDFCDDSNVCTDDICDPASGCVHSSVDCVADESLCTNETCDPFHGCLSIQRDCSAGTDEEECRIYSCNVTDGLCGYREEDCSPILLIATAAAVSTAVIIGIVIAIVVVLALAGGGAYAYTRTMGDASAAPAMNNPIYAGRGNEGVNPLHKA